MRSLLAALVLFALLSPAIPLASPAGAQTAKWTFMVYMAGDNNLEPVGITDFLEMSSVGSTSQVNVVVQFDRAVGYSRDNGDWTTAKRFYVTPGMAPDPPNAVQDLGEVDMTDPAVLEDFIVWAMTSYPADRYFLDIWDHGLGWQGVVTDGPGFLSTAGLGQAVANATARVGRGLDIVGNDACRMTLEIMVELAPYVDYFVGSQKDEPFDGWPYDAVVAGLAADPDMTAAQLGDLVVEAYVDSYVNNTPYSVTLSTVSSAALPFLLASLDAYVDELNRSLPFYQSPVILARSQTEHYEKNGLAGGEEYDLYHFTERIDANLQNGRLTRLGDGLRASIVNAVVSERHWDHPNPVNGVRAANAHGLSVWFPDIPTEPAYVGLEMSRIARWDDFLNGYRDGEPPDVSLETRAEPFDGDGNGLPDAIKLEYRTGVDGVVGVDLYADGAYVMSHTYTATAGPWEPATLTALPPGDYAAYVYLWNETKLLNVSVLPSIGVEGIVWFRGTVRSLAGAMLVGADVTLRNTRTDETLAATVTATGFEIPAMFPSWFRDGDVLELTASHGGRTTTVSFEASVRGPTQTIHMFLDTDGDGTATGLMLAVIAVLAIVVALLAVARLWPRLVRKT